MKPGATSAETREPGLPRRLELLRREAERFSQTDQQIDVREMLVGMTPLLRLLAGRRGVQVSVDVPGALPMVIAKHDILRQMVVGLAGHLVRRAEEGRLEVGAAGVEGEVRLRMTYLPLPAGLEGAHSRPAGEVGASDDDNLDKLSVVEELATLERATLRRLHVERGGEGFDLVLSARQPRTVLLIDDNEDVLHLFRRYLSGSAYRIVTAGAGAEALRLAEETHPDIITLDLLMGNRDGWEVLQSMRHHERLRRIPILVCSVLPERELALALGAAGFLPKPVSQEDLLGALESLVGYARALALSSPEQSPTSESAPPAGTPPPS